MECTKIITFLKRSICENKIVSVFSNREEPGKCSVGYVEAATEEQVLIKHVTPTGMADGYAIRRLEDVFRVDIDGQYEQKLHRLYSLQNQSHKAFVINQVEHETNLFKEILNNAKDLDLVVNICIDETESQDSIIGLVKEISDIEVVITQISEYGQMDGESFIFIDDIIKLNCDSEDEHIIGVLYQDNKNITKN